MSPTAESEALHARVRSFIDAARSEPFDGLALAIARFQARHVPALARLCAARGVDLGSAVSAGAIPAVPAEAFRLARIAAHPPELDERVFRTSGTTGALRGEHAFRTTATYEHAALAWARVMLLSEASSFAAIVLGPPLEDAPDSSLGFMIDRFARACGGPASWHIRASADGAGVLDVEGLGRACAGARARGRPALVLGTSFAFVHLQDASGRPDLTLPRGSLAMVTGGFKGRVREVSADEMRAVVGGMFALPPASIVGEYGMTELSSQLYEGTLSGGPQGVYRGPPWLRAQAVDPTTLAALPTGEVGLARFVDLANVDSAVAVQTNDLVRVVGAGVELLGRQPGSTPRGCSLAIDQMLERA